MSAEQIRAAERDVERAKAARAPSIINIVSMPHEGEHKLVVLTSDGRLFERIRDPRNFNTTGRVQDNYLWRQFKGPLDAAE